jgi:hypothetical protein
MERGPMALFGAIVAIGLGPALWLGVQIGDVPVTRERPPLVQSEQRQGEQRQSVTGTEPGGEGAGADDPGPGRTPEPQRKAETKPLKPAKPKPSESKTDEPVEQESSPAPEESSPAPDEEETTAPPVEEDTTVPDEPSDDESAPTA